MNTPAAKFLAESTKNYHQEIGILCLGPLTNLALASHLTK
jgi:inosine-uridine nucleoside N-ribohydrolase